CDPDKVRRRAADLAQTGREFLEASWTVTAMGGDAPLDTAGLDLSESGYRTFSAVRDESLAAGVPWWQIVPRGFLVDDESHTGAVVDIDSAEPPAPRGKESELDALGARLRTHVTG